MLCVLYLKLYAYLVHTVLMCTLFSIQSTIAVWVRSVIVLMNIVYIICILSVLMFLMSGNHAMVMCECGVHELLVKYIHVYLC